MIRLIRNFTVWLRRFFLSLILLVPQPVRAHLSRSDLLTRLFVFLDRAKYEPIMDAESWRKRGASAAGLSSAPPRGNYRYTQPEMTDEVAALLASKELPMISVIMPVYNTPAIWLTRAIESVHAQWYPNWELCIVDDHSHHPDTLRVLRSVEDPRVRVRHLEENRNITGASNAALEVARGDYIALLDHDDELTPDALYEVWRVIESEGAEFIYSDEDKLDEQGNSCDPHFKADFAPDMLLSQNYLSHLAVIRKSLVERVGGFTRGTDGAQDYDLYLKVLEHTEAIAHVPKVLYHWRKVPGSTAAFFSEKSYAQDAGKRALEAAVERRGLKAQVHSGKFPGTYRVRYELDDEPLVSIVIPFKDRPDLLRLCVGTILSRTSYRNFEIIAMSNNSTESATFAEMDRLSALDSRVQFREHNRPFNFSEINNYAVRDFARGDHVVLLNNDIEIIAPDWIECLLEFSQRPDVGVVGGKLLYPDGSLQHAGVVLGIGGVAGHSHKYLLAEHHGYFSRPHIVQNMSALTAACWMVKRSIYRRLGGLDEDNLRVAFNDVDFCLRVREQSYLNVYTPYCEAIHHESISRGKEDTREKQERFRQEVLYMMNRHAATLSAGDPYYNPNLTLNREDFSLRDHLLVQ